MSALAQILCARGYAVSGSDRSHDYGESSAKFEALQNLGIELFKQDGSGVHKGLHKVIASTAIEAEIPDLSTAKACGIEIQKRSSLLAELFHQGQGIAIGGTSGKSTVTAMLGYLLHALDFDPLVINGATIVNPISDGLGNIILGKGENVLIEADESDGSIELYKPYIATINNITLDHKPLEELRILFADFAQRAHHCVINKDCPESMALFADLPATTFSLEDASADLFADNIHIKDQRYHYELDGKEFSLQTPGNHNIANALTAIAAAEFLGVDRYHAAKTLEGFLGVRRRLEMIGEKAGITVIDDFAHNPDKIAATLDTLNAIYKRLFIFFQPHGFAPTRLMKEGYIASFNAHLSTDDYLLMPEIYFAGGTAAKDISSKDIVSKIHPAQHLFCETRQLAKDSMLNAAESGDAIVIMGARDDTLTDFAREILSEIKA